MTAGSAMTREMGVAEWTIWTTTARVVVTDSELLASARAITETRLDEIGAAASRFRVDSEVCRIAESGDGRPVTISYVLADLVDIALNAAWRTGGDVDPTLGADLIELGYVDGSAPTASSTSARRGALALRRRATFRDVELDGHRLRVPAGVLLDLGATAKARAADLCASEIARTLGCGALVSLGGDLRVAGPPPESGWQVLVQDGSDEPASTIELAGAEAVATSSTLHRVWTGPQGSMHHILDPTLRRPAAPVWRTVTVAASTCVEANTLSTAAIVRGRGALGLLEAAGLPARLVAADGCITRVGGWPA